MAEYKKQAQTAPKQASQNTQKPQAPVTTPTVKARIDGFVDEDNNPTKAYASVTIADIMAIHKVRVFKTKAGSMYVSLPYEKHVDSEGEVHYNEYAHPITPELRRQLTQTVLSAYDQALQARQEQSNSQSESEKETQAAKPKQLKPEM